MLLSTFGRFGINKKMNNSEAAKRNVYISYTCNTAEKLILTEGNGEQTALMTIFT